VQAQTFEEFKVLWSPDGHNENVGMVFEVYAESKEAAHMCARLNMWAIMCNFMWTPYDEDDEE